MTTSHTARPSRPVRVSSPPTSTPLQETSTQPDFPEISVVFTSSLILSSIFSTSMRALKGARPSRGPPYAKEGDAASASTSAHRTQHDARILPLSAPEEATNTKRNNTWATKLGKTQRLREILSSFSALQFCGVGIPPGYHWSPATEVVAQAHRANRSRKSCLYI